LIRREDGSEGNKSSLEQMEQIGANYSPYIWDICVGQRRLILSSLVVGKVVQSGWYSVKIKMSIALHWNSFAREGDQFATFAKTINCPVLLDRQCKEREREREKSTTRNHETRSFSHDQFYSLLFRAADTNQSMCVCNISLSAKRQVRESIFVDRESEFHLFSSTLKGTREYREREREREREAVNLEIYRRGNNIKR